MPPEEPAPGATPGLTPAPLPADAVEVGRVAGAWGVLGWLRIHPHSASADALLHSSDWFLQPPRPRGGGQGGAATYRAAVRDLHAQGGGLVAKIEGVADRSAAQALRDSAIFIPRAAFPPLAAGEYYWTDLIGLAVINHRGEDLGCVADLMESGAQQVLVVTDASAAQPRERLVPFVDAWIDQVDFAARRIVVRWESDY